MNKAFKKKIVVIGCSSIGARIASYMGAKGSSVTVIDKDKNSFKRLSHSFSGYLYEGDGTNINILREVEVSNCDIAIITTQNDNVNSMIAQICKTILEIKRVVVKMDEHDCDDILLKQDIKIINTTELGLESFLDSEIKG